MNPINSLSINSKLARRAVHPLHPNFSSIIGQKVSSQITVFVKTRHVNPNCLTPI